LDFVHQNFWLIIMTVTSGVMLAFPKLLGSVGGVPEVDVTQAVQMINHENAVVLDVREPSEFAAGHIANAHLVPLGQVKDSIKTLEKFRNQAVVVSCRSGNRSGTACSILRKAGFTRVYNLSGGIIAWQKAQMPTVK
jgi:rhodanese-related sulfurtransferase